MHFALGQCIAATDRPQQDIVQPKVILEQQHTHGVIQSVKNFQTIGVGLQQLQGVQGMLISGGKDTAAEVQRPLQALAVAVQQVQPEVLHNPSLAGKLPLREFGQAGSDLF
ncbi:hypothetical protein D3C78_1648010 [compost metagenome]